MKNVLCLLFICLMSTLSIQAQNGLKLADTKGNNLTAISKSAMTKLILDQKSQILISSKPRVINKKDYSYVTFTVTKKEGQEQATIAFQIDKMTGYTSNFKFVCRGECMDGGCSFTYDHKGYIDGCTCCGLDIERIPSRNKLSEEDFGF